ncbi:MULTISPECIES: hypothetical protein [unclassified Ketobacter]|uniref:hypothetical protein n=1 Tax=unclassified Ketobacter TaxID=2639109 RepID=UPI000F1D4D71|nr:MULTISPECIES: hypothetical protein [unclassified Ketobacter]RLT88331.1 MAG: hypothetical protein D9N13_14150 [Ketobacter sp. GenoA1]RLT95594.1 MAG: hypothetical protein D9N15_15085 [Ketobacter sp.]
MPEHFTGRRNLIFLATFLLCIPALFTGFMGDDYLHYALLNADLPIAKPDDLSLFGLFSFINGDPERNRLLMDYSLIPWWTYSELKYAFWRPLSELSHWLDYQLWPNQPWLMHLHNIVWYMGALVLIAKLYQRFQPGEGAALLALFLYALDSSHGFTISWISNRNALLALLFGLLTLYFHCRWREENRSILLLCALSSQLMALFSAELGISVFGYIGAYALFMDRKGPVKGVLAAIPYFVVIVIWWVIYKDAGFGAAHADAYYVDPATQPTAFVVAAIERLPVLLASQWGLIPADLYTLTPGDKQAYSVLCGLFLLFVLVPVCALLRRNKTTLFWLCGMVFSILPALAASPYDRLLLFPGIGAAGLLGHFMHMIWVKKERPGNTAMRFYTLTVFGILALFHLILAPLLLPVMTYSTKIMAEAVSDKPSYFDAVEDIANKRLVLFSPPLASSLAIAGLRFYRNEPMPERIWTITTLEGEFNTRADGHKMVITREGGFMANPTEESVRNLKKYPFKNGDRVELSGLTIEVSKTGSTGRPTELTLLFDDPVSSDQYQFLKWNPAVNRYEKFEIN